MPKEQRRPCRHRALPAALRFQLRYRFAAQMRTLALLALLAPVSHYRYADAEEMA